MYVHFVVFYCISFTVPPVFSIPGTEAGEGGLDVIIDGANVGYANQRPDRGDSLNFSQIDRVVVSHFMTTVKKPASQRIRVLRVPAGYSAGYAQVQNNPS